MPEVTNPFRITLNINFKNAGWSEKYFTNVTDAAGALTIATNIALYRTAFFGAEVELVYAHASQTDSSKDAISCALDYPLGPHKAVSSSVQPPNDPFSAVQQRFETANGRWINRMYRGLPDDQIPGDTILNKDIFRPLNPGVAPYDPNGNASLLNIQKSFWSYLILNYPHARKSGSNVYTMTAWARVMPIRVSKHATGRPFGLFRGKRRSNLVS